MPQSLVITDRGAYYRSLVLALAGLVYSASYDKRRKGFTYAIHRYDYFFATTQWMCTFCTIYLIDD